VEVENENQEYILGSLLSTQRSVMTAWLLHTGRFATGVELRYHQSKNAAASTMHNMILQINLNSCRHPPEDLPTNPSSRIGSVETTFDSERKD